MGNFLIILHGLLYFRQAKNLQAFVVIFSRTVLVCYFDGLLYGYFDVDTDSLNQGWNGVSAF
jgi:hypothetical protein